MGVFQSTCCQDATSVELGHEPVTVSMNVSTKEVHFSTSASSLDESAAPKRPSNVGFYADDVGAVGALSEEFEGVAPDENREDEYSPEEQTRIRLVRNQTFYLLNGVEDEDEFGPQLTEKSLASVRSFSLHVARTVSRRSGLGDSRETQDTAGEVSEKDKMEATKAEMIQHVTTLVDQAYDILPAEMMLAEIEKLIGQERFVKEVLSSDLFERFARKLDFFYDVGISCSESQSDWMEVYSGDGGKQLITGLIDADDPTVLQYTVRCEIPASITHVMAVANEIQLMPKWNSLIVKEPQVIGRRTAHYMVLNYQISAVGGMYKVDALNEIRRFSDPAGGFLVEYVTSVAPDHPSYKEPLKGYKRMQTFLKNVFIACGPEYTVLIQRGRLKLPFSVTRWVAKTIGGVAGKFILGGLVSNSLLPRKPGNDWEALIQEDKFGLYHRLDELRKSENSEDRNPTKTEDGKVAPYDIDSFFSKRRFARASARKTVLLDITGTPSCT